MAGLRAVSAAEAAEVIRAGGVALVPTETVVGLVAADAGRLNEIKGSDPGKPVALLCATAEQAFALAADVPPPARRLAELYWPGPLTLVLDRPGGGTVGVRVPDHEAIRALLASYAGPLYATSANLSGEPAPRRVGDVDARVARAADVVVGGEPGSGEASAVVDLSDGRRRLLRASADLTEETLNRL